MSTPIRVMVADDHSVVRQGIRHVLEAGDEFTVVAEAAHGGEVEALVEQHQPDVVVLDYRLPGEEAEPGENVLADQQIEALKQFSYAFAISPSIEDANKKATSNQYEPAGRLFHMRVMIFRSFIAPVEGGDPPSPIFELDFEVAI